MSAAHATVNQGIRAKQAKVGIIGRGHVGLPLAVEFARAGLDATGRGVRELPRLRRLYGKGGGGR